MCIQTTCKKIKISVKERQNTIIIFLDYITFRACIVALQMIVYGRGRQAGRQAVAIRKNDWLFLSGAGGASKREFIDGDPEGERWRILKIYSLHQLYHAKSNPFFPIFSPRILYLREIFFFIIIISVRFPPHLLKIIYNNISLDSDSSVSRCTFKNCNAHTLYYYYYYFNNTFIACE